MLARLRWGTDDLAPMAPMLGLATELSQCPARTVVCVLALKRSAMQACGGPHPSRRDVCKPLGARAYRRAAVNPIVRCVPDRPCGVSCNATTKVAWLV